MGKDQPKIYLLVGSMDAAQEWAEEHNFSPDRWHRVNSKHHLAGVLGPNRLKGSLWEFVYLPDWRTVIDKIDLDEFVKMAVDRGFHSPQDYHFSERLDPPPPRNRPHDKVERALSAFITEVEAGCIEEMGVTLEQHVQNAYIAEGQTDFSLRVCRGLVLARVVLEDRAFALDPVRREPVDA